MFIRYSALISRTISKKINDKQICHNSTISISEFVKTITIRTCVGLYDELRLSKPELYKNAPSEGVDLTVNYVDTWHDKGSKPYEKVIVAVHGTADSYQTFTRLIEHFQPMPNVRVIVPNTPDFSHTRATNFAFWHSTIEKYYFLKDLLHKLNIKRIDCLIGHSLGIQPCSVIWEKPDNIEIKSVGLISPQFLLIPFDQKFSNFAKFTLRLSKSKFGHKFLEWIKLYKSSAIPFRFTSMDQLYLLNCVFHENDLPNGVAKRRVNLLKKLSLPGFLVYGSNESMIPQSHLKALYQTLNISDDDQIFIENDNPNLLPQHILPPRELISLIFKDASHFPHAKFPKVTNYLVEKLIFDEK